MIFWASAAWAVTYNVPADFSSVQEAIDEVADGDTIEIDPGTHDLPTSVHRPVILRGAGAGTTVLTYAANHADVSASGVVIESLTLQGAGTPGTIQRLLKVGGELTLQDAEVLDGVSESASGIGGGVWTLGTLHAIRTEFRGNRANYGGAIFGGDGSQITLVDCTFQANSVSGAQSPDGGAVALRDAAHLTVSGGSFLDNTATGSRGGALSAVGLATVAVSDANFEGNAAENGGAIRVTGGAELTTTNNTFSSNVGERGGALHVESSTWKATEDLFVGNTGTEGGAAFIDDGSVELLGTSLCENSAEHGGALRVLDGDVWVANSVLISNAGSVSGGFLSTDALMAPVLHHSFAAGNSSPDGSLVGGIGESIVEFSVLGNHDYALVLSGSIEGTLSYPLHLVDLIPPTVALTNALQSNSSPYASYPSCPRSEELRLLPGTLAQDHGPGVDPDGSPADLGPTGGPEAHPNLWIDGDGDGSPVALDCSDGEPLIYPGAVDIPGDGIDQDCDGIDPAAPVHTGTTGSTGATGDTGTTPPKSTGETGVNTSPTSPTGGTGETQVRDTAPDESPVDTAETVESAGKPLPPGCGCTNHELLWHGVPFGARR